MADCDLDFDRSEIRGAITTPAFRMKNPLSGWIPVPDTGVGSMSAPADIIIHSREIFSCRAWKQP